MNELSVKKPKARLDYVDLAKGIVMFLCVLGHAVAFGDIVFRIIFAFHMPFFFIISGWCRSEIKSQKSFVQALKKSALKLLFVSVLYRIIYVFAFSDFNSMKNALVSVFLDPYTEWFLPTMFASNLFFWIFEKYYIIKNRDKSAQNIAVVFALIAFSSIFAVLYKPLHMKVGFPFSLDCIFLGFTFTVIGYYLNCCIRKNSIKISAQQPSVIVLALLLVATIVMVLFNGYVNICDAKIGESSAFAFFAAVFISLAVIWFSNKYMVLCKINTIANVLSCLIRLWGKYSLWVYILHLIIFKLLRKHLFAHFAVSHIANVFLMCFITMTIITIILLILDKIKIIMKTKKG